jgi:hypothetical protein
VLAVNGNAVRSHLVMQARMGALLEQVDVVLREPAVSAVQWLEGWRSFGHLVR